MEMLRLWMKDQRMEWNGSKIWWGKRNLYLNQIQLFEIIGSSTFYRFHFSSNLEFSSKHGFMVFIFCCIGFFFGILHNDNFSQIDSFWQLLGCVWIKNLTILFLFKEFNILNCGILFHFFSLRILYSNAVLILIFAKENDICADWGFPTSQPISVAKFDMAILPS